MSEFIAILAISICLVAIGFVIKIYKESPKIENRIEDD